MREVLLVYDDPGLRDSYTAALQRAGFTVRATGSPLIALDYLDDRLPAVLVTRVNYGEGRLNGIALAKMARQRCVRLPVVFLTRPEWSQMAGEIGTVQPPAVSPGELVAAVCSAIAAL